MKTVLAWLLASLVAHLAVSTSPAADDAANPQKNLTGESARRILRFPTDRAVGTVYWRQLAGKRDVINAIYADNWQPLGKTRGRVRLPADVEVRLDVSKAASRDLSWLDDLDPNDIQALNLRNTDVRDDDLPRVARLTGLRFVDLHSTRITDAGLKGFDALVNLEEIVLDAFAVNREGFGVGDGAMRVLARLPKLRVLRLRLTKVTDAGLAELADCRSLTYLALAGTRVSDAGLIHLTKLPLLEDLSLGVYNEGANITNEGLRTVGELTNLTSLDLSGTKITGEGLVHLKKLKRLKSLSLDSTDVAENDLEHLQPLQSLERLRLYTKHNTTDVAAAHLARLKSLRDLTDNLYVTDKGVALLASMPHLEDISLSGEEVTDASGGSIASMKSLKWLMFQDCPITDATLEEIAQLPNLEYLTLSHTRVTGDGFKHLRNTPKLSILSVDFDSDKDQPPAAERPHLREIGKLTQVKDLRIQGNELASATSSLETGVGGIQPDVGNSD